MRLEEQVLQPQLPWRPPAEVAQICSGLSPVRGPILDTVSMCGLTSATQK